MEPVEDGEVDPPTAKAAWQSFWQKQKKTNPALGKTKVNCTVCNASITPGGPLQVHMLTKHPLSSSQKLFSPAAPPRSSRFRRLLEWVRGKETPSTNSQVENRDELVVDFGEEEVENFVKDLLEQPSAADGDPAPMEIDQDNIEKEIDSSDGDDADGVEPQPKKTRRRGQSQRIRRNVKFKRNVIALYDRIYDELVQKEGNADLVKQVDVLREMSGLCSTSAATIKKWVQKRGKILEAYSASQKRKSKTVRTLPSKGRFALAEERTFAWVKEQRQGNLRVGKVALFEKWKSEIEAEIAVGANGKPFKFSQNAFDRFKKRFKMRMRVAGSTKAVTNDEAVAMGTTWVRKIIQLRKVGSLPLHESANVAAWFQAEGILPQSSFFGFFHPSTFVMFDEVPFNFLPGGETVCLSGEVATVKSVTGVGKRMGTLVLAFSTSGEILDIIIIFKGKKVQKQETAYFKTFEAQGVRVVFNESSYIEQQIVSDQFIGKVLRDYRSRLGMSAVQP